jgi:arylsulfatase A-like enzyme
LAIALGVGCLFLGQPCHAGGRRVGRERPNLVFLFADDQPANCTGYSGNEAIETPHLDALAQRGTVFTNAFVTTAICCSNRACILTGQTMRRHGITDFRTPLSQHAFANTYPAILRREGYRTGFLGKYAIGNPQSHAAELALPASQFDFWYGFPQSISYKQTVGGETRFLTSVMTEKAIEFLETDDKRPFCMTVAFKEPHGPFNYFDPRAENPYAEVQLPASGTFTRADFQDQPEFIRRSLNGSGSRGLLENPERYQAQLRTFYRTVTRADQAVGEILAALKRLRLDENTVVIYSSDHGSLLGDHGLTGKWLMYENSIRVPLIIDDPRTRSRGASVGEGAQVQVPRQRDEMVLSIDLAPTMLSLAGVPIPDSMEGRDLTPLLTAARETSADRRSRPPDSRRRDAGGGSLTAPAPVERQESASWRSYFYYEHTYSPESGSRAPIPRTEGIRTESWKYIRFPDQKPVYEQLFDLKNDPFERHNLIQTHGNADFVIALRSLCDQGP